MAWPAGTHLQNLIDQFNRHFQRTRIRKQDHDDSRAFVELEGWWKDYRIIVSEIHRKDGTVRYTYLHEELPHQHTPDGGIRLTERIDFGGFLKWVEKNL